MNINETLIKEAENTEEVSTESTENAETALQTSVTTQTNLTFNSFNFLDTKMVKEVYKVSQLLASSDLVPSTYRSKPQNVMLALSISNQTGVDIITTMNNLYIIQGKPSWSGQYCIMAINRCGRFKPLYFEYYHEDKTDPNKVTGCCACAVEKETGKVFYSDKVDYNMVRAFGWDSKPNSFWNKMPVTMMKYRSAAFFARTYCPEVLAGYYTADENRDITGNYDEVVEEKKVTFTKGVIND